MQADDRPWLRPGAVTTMWNRFLTGDARVSWARLWSVVVLEDWLERNAMTT